MSPFALGGLEDRNPQNAAASYGFFSCARSFSMGLTWEFMPSDTFFALRGSVNLAVKSEFVIRFTDRP